MGQVKKIILVVLCMITIAISCIVSASAYSDIPTQDILMYPNNGYSVISGQSHIDFAIIYNELDDGDNYGDPYTLHLVPVDSFSDLQLMLNSWNYQNEGQNWILWHYLLATEYSIYYQTQIENNEHGRATQIVLRPTNQDLLDTMYVEFGAYYQFFYTINKSMGEDPYQWCVMGEDFDIGYHAMEYQSNGELLYDLRHSVRFYTNTTRTFTVNTYVQSYDNDDFTGDYINSEGLRIQMIVEPFDDIFYLEQIDEAYVNGWGNGYNTGYEDGFNVGEHENYSFYDLASIIIKGPIDFLKTALNFEIFGVNVQQTVLFIFTVLIVLAVITIFMRIVT